MFEDDGPNPPASRAPSSKDVAGEDFLFHLYRGSELLQDNRVHEAKQELEHALSLQPRDAKGQDLLAIVYFRLGLYPRAIQIYEALIILHPVAPTPRINLALCYLKTGQASAARAELERVLELSPNHSRAWGYLGLAFQRLGDYERACQAFLAGGHDAMARRLSELSGVFVDEASGSAPDRALVGRAAGEAFDELAKRGEEAVEAEPFRTDSGTQKARPSGTWAAVEPGRDLGPEIRRGSPAILSPSIVPSLAPSESLLPPLPTRADEPTTVETDTSIPPPPAPPRFEGPASSRVRSVPAAPPSFSSPPVLGTPEQPEAFARRLLLVFPRQHTAALHPSGFALLQSMSSIAVRFDMVRALTFPSGFTTMMMNRHARGRDLDEPFGGAASPLFRIEGAGNLVMGPSVGTRLSLISVADASLFVRESALIALEAPVGYENGKLAGGDGDSIAMVQLRATGDATGGSESAPSMSGRSPVRQGRSVVLALPQTVTSVEVGAGHSLLLRAHSVIGWTGRIVPHALAPSEAPGKMRGFISLAGEGMVIVDAR